MSDSILYCSRCNKPLGKVVDICPFCGASANRASQSGARLEGAHAAADFPIDEIGEFLSVGARAQPLPDSPPRAIRSQPVNAAPGPEEIGRDAIAPVAMHAVEGTAATVSVADQTPVRPVVSPVPASQAQAPTQLSVNESLVSEDDRQEAAAPEAEQAKATVASSGPGNPFRTFGALAWIAGVAVISVVAYFAYDLAQSRRARLPADSSTVAKISRLVEKPAADVATTPPLPAAQAVPAAPSPVSRAPDKASHEQKELLGKIEERERQDTVAAKLATAEQCLRARNYLCVKARTDEALRLQPGNPQAVELARKAEKDKIVVVDNALTKADQCARTQDAACAFAWIGEVLRIDPRNPSAEQLRRTISAMSVRKPKPEPTEALQGTAVKTLSKADEPPQTTRSLIEKTLAEGVDCMRSREFQCALARAQRALTLDPGNQSASSMRDEAAKRLIVIE